MSQPTDNTDLEASELLRKLESHFASGVECLRLLQRNNLVIGAPKSSPELCATADGRSIHMADTNGSVVNSGVSEPSAQPLRPEIPPDWDYEWTTSRLNLITHYNPTPECKSILCIRVEMHCRGE